MVSEHERGLIFDQPAAPVASAAGPLAHTPSRAGAAVARAQELAARAVAAVATAHDVLDGTDAALREVAATRAALGDAVGVLAARLRRDGAPPERMLILVKDAARAATPPGADPPAARDLMAHAVRRGIEAYFAA